MSMFYLHKNSLPFSTMYFDRIVTNHCRLCTVKTTQAEHFCFDFLSFLFDLPMMRLRSCVVKSHPPGSLMSLSVTRKSSSVMQLTETVLLMSQFKWTVNSSQRQLMNFTTQLRASSFHSNTVEQLSRTNTTWLAYLDSYHAPHAIMAASWPKKRFYQNQNR